MKTNIFQDGDITFVELSGYMDFETAHTASRTIDEIYKGNRQAKVVIDLDRLQFVGSSGISVFIKNLRSFNTLQVKPSYHGLKSEFVKLFRAFEEDESFDVADNRDAARQAIVSRFDHSAMIAKPVRAKSKK